MIARLSLVLFACVFVLPLAAGCGGSGTPDTIKNVTASSTAATNDPAATPISQMPVSRFALALEDLDTSAFRTDVAGVFNMDAASYAASKTFDSADAGEKLLNEWGYQGGYEAGYIPIGSTQAILNGSYYAYVEVHLFKTADGAKQAYDYFARRIEKPNTQKAEIPVVGNEASAYTTTAGYVAGTEVPAVAQQILFRRGNVVGVVLASGAQGFVTVDTARDLAMIEDDKILGKIRAPVPTPTSNFTPNTGTGEGIPPSSTPAPEGTAAQ